ncbi:MAG TPA: transketolase [Caulobacteraceae bacterium]
MTVQPLSMANAIRALSMDAVHRAKSGHQGMPMGMADVATVLWTKFLKYDAAKPQWPDRDRFVLSAGHGSMLLYSLLHLTGYPGMTIDEIKNFRQWGSITPGHPEYGHTPGVETTTGPLGQGLATAVGMAMAERSMNARHGDDLVDHRTWVIAGDGCLMEGVSHEAIHLAGRLKLNKLIVLFDDNNTTIDGRATISETGDQQARFKAAGWAVKAVDGHDYAKITAAMRWATRQDKPVMLACKTLISKGAGSKEGDAHSHGYALFDAEIAAARVAMGWTAAPFEIPDDIAEGWKKAGKRGARDRRRWDARLKAADNLRPDFLRAVKGVLPKDAFAALDAHIAKAAVEKPAAATRQHSGAALEQLTPFIPEMIGGSADLTGSNNTFVKGMVAYDTPDYAGRYVHYGVREFGMAAALNGMALHGGVIPYSGTFLVFSDYSRPAIRLSALMGAKAIHVMTHDSIGVGEDGPTHQPVEHLAALRAIPHLLVFRPADAVETAECWKAALAETTPSLMALSRQKTAASRTSGGDLCAKGAYEIASAEGKAQVTLFACGTEVAVAMAARDLLQADGVATRVVSTPCWELFDRQSAKYQAETIGRNTLRLAVDAGVRQGWERFIGEDGLFVGMHGFGASAPAERLYQEFGITAEAVAAAVKAKLG